MGKKLTEASITTKNARSNLSPGLHWRGIDPDVHLGYRKSKRGGAWLVRWRNGTGYRQAPLGTADDVFEADGKESFNYAQAASAARAHVAAARVEAKAAAEGPTPTVRMACETYLTAIEGRHERLDAKAPKNSRSRLRVHVLSDEKIVDLALHKLRSSDLVDWKARVRAKKITETTVRRILSDFRAALNAAGSQYRSRLPAEFIVAIRDGFAIATGDPAADSDRPNIILSDNEVRLIVQAAAEIDAEQGWDGALYRLVLALAATGARYSQLIKMTCADVQSFEKRLVVPSSNKGRSPRKRPPALVHVGDDALTILKKAMANRSGRALLFLRWGYRRDGGIKWAKDKLRGWQTSEITDPFKEIVARAELSSDVTAYALRHSSIVRGLREGQPVRLVAALHDTSSEMIERYYSRFITDALSALAAKSVIPLVV